MANIIDNQTFRKLYTQSEASIVMARLQSLITREVDGSYLTRAPNARVNKTKNVAAMMTAAGSIMGVSQPKAKKNAVEMRNINFKIVNNSTGVFIPTGLEIKNVGDIFVSENMSLTEPGSETLIKFLCKKSMDLDGAEIRLHGTLCFSGDHYHRFELLVCASSRHWVIEELIHHSGIGIPSEMYKTPVNRYGSPVFFCTGFHDNDDAGCGVILARNDRANSGIHNVVALTDEEAFSVVFTPWLAEAGKVFDN